MSSAASLRSQVVVLALLSSIVGGAGLVPAMAQDNPEDRLSDDFEDANQADFDPIARAREARTRLTEAKRGVAQGEKLEKQETAAKNEADRSRLHEQVAKAYSGAIENFRGALRADPKLVEAWIGLAELMVRAGRFDQAVQTFDRALALEADSAEALAGKARAIAGKGRTQLAGFKVSEAQATYETLAALDAAAARGFLAEMRTWLESIRPKLGPEMNDAVTSLDAWIREREAK